MQWRSCLFVSRAADPDAIPTHYEVGFDSSGHEADCAGIILTEGIEEWLQVNKDFQNGSEIQTFGD